MRLTIVISINIDWQQQRSFKCQYVTNVPSAFTPLDMVWNRRFSGSYDARSFKRP